MRVKVKAANLHEADAAVGEPEIEGAAQIEPAEVESEVEENDEKGPRRLRLSISLRSLVIAAVIFGLLCTVGVLAWLYIGSQHKLDVQARRSENNAHAEKSALDYAVNAAEMNFEKLDAWKSKLVAGTSPELNEKLSKAGTEMEQILVPLRWTSTARPLEAKVRSDTDGVYVVNCFVSVLTKTTQAPEPLQSTATYEVTIDSKKNWQITDVGGIGGVVEQK